MVAPRLGSARLDSQITFGFADAVRVTLRTTPRIDGLTAENIVGASFRSRMASLV